MSREFPVTDLDDEVVLEVIGRGDLVIEGRLIAASNTTLAARASLDGIDVACVYKPTRGERPLWDFPDGTLGHREVAAYLLATLLADAGGEMPLVPATAWRTDGPLGPGMAQAFVHIEDGVAPLVDVVPQGAVDQGWRAVLDAYGRDGEPVTLVHRDDPALRLIALFDAVINNADRKAGHVLPTSCGPRAIDHGVSFAVEGKLRTVLWGWVGEPLAAAEQERLAGLRDRLSRDPRFLDHLSAAEIRQTLLRIDALLSSGCFPEPDEGWPAIPWPVF